MKYRNKLLKMILAAMFLALSYVMPFLTGQIPEIGAAGRSIGIADAL